MTVVWPVCNMLSIFVQWDMAIMWNVVCKYVYSAHSHMCDTSDWKIKHMWHVCGGHFLFLAKHAGIDALMILLPVMLSWQHSDPHVGNYTVTVTLTTMLWCQWQ